MYYQGIKCIDNISTRMAPSRESDDQKPGLYDTLSSKYDEIKTKATNAVPSPSGLFVNGSAASIIVTASMGVLLLAQPAVAQVSEMGNSVCSAGGGWLATAAGILAAVALIVKGATRTFSAVDDMGSVDDQKRDQARGAAKRAGLTMGGGLVGVPFIGALLGRVLPSSWSCLGFDISFLGGGGGGGGAAMITPYMASIDLSIVLTVLPF